MGGDSILRPGDVYMQSLSASGVDVTNDWVEVRVMVGYIPSH